MSSHSSAPQAETLRQLVAHIQRAGLQSPVLVALDVLRPVDFLSSQVVLFVQPFSRGSSWERYTAALTEEASWGELRALLAPERAASHQPPPPDES
jgi:hypothetical protein